jgi:hypothetical protein
MAAAFRHKHFMHSFREIAAGLRTYAEALAQSRKLKFPQGVDSALVVTTVYLHFFMFFLVENLFGASGALECQTSEQWSRCSACI